MTEATKTEEKVVEKKDPVKKTAKSKRGKRYSAKDQASLLKKYKAERKSGTSAMDAAKKVGVSYITLLGWEKKAGKKAKVGRPKKKASKKGKVGRPKKKTSKRGRPKKTATKKVSKRGRPKKAKTVQKKVSKITRKSQMKKGSNGLALVTPGGFRIEGINVKDLISVLKTLR